MSTLAGLSAAQLHALNCRERLMSTPAGLSALSGSLLLSRKESEARSVGKASNKVVSDKVKNFDHS